jgi:hypothetical protein
MGVNLAWFAVQGIAPETFLERAGFEDTGEPDEYFECDHSGGELPDGWYVMVTDRVDLVDPARLAQWSAGGRLVACVVLEGAMNSLAMEWRDGKQIWSVFWDGGAEEKQLQVEGQLPDNFNEVREDIAALHAEMDRDGGGVDVVFELPLDLAEEITGFRHDQMGFDDDIPVFNALEPIRFAEG